jgi:hypothetical protein
MFYSVPTNHNCLDVYSESVPRSRATLRICNNLMHMWHHVTNHLIISNDKDSNSENRIKLRVRDRRVAFLDVSCYFRFIQGICVRTHPGRSCHGCVVLFGFLSISPYH